MVDGAAGEQTGKRAIVYTSAYRGGASWFVLEMAAGMSAAGGDILLIAPRAEPEEREQLVAATRRIELPRGSYGKGSKLVRLLRTAGRIVSTFIAFARARRHARTYVISFYDWLIILALQMVWIRLIGGRLIYVVHDAKPHAWASSPTMRWLELMLLRASYLLPHELVTLTRSAKDQIKEEFGRRGQATVIPHGAYATATTLPPGDRKILVFGMLRRNKRILETIEAVKLAVASGARVSLTIAGAPHKEDIGYWDECAACLPGTDGYIHTEIEFIPEPRLNQLIAECDAVILPYEDFNSQSGVAVLAACSERLLLCTATGGLAELVEQGLDPIVIQQPVTPDPLLMQSLISQQCRWKNYETRQVRVNAPWIPISIGGESVRNT
ncbi:hypothetical protein C7W88_17550 (plasmid) [Novosphingobium sp. THN1]|uniref:glycosyltransferase family 4 protein n=1 Tax=Novosphingobium sp. THN1 TaxID=1016987 RepID=UPI000E4BFF5A|nr:glycosyltransferase family 4 protein [Novosphingobium sp. THN1]AXU20833.1 hypothetical protein C7W88_17550 [Novosphingobium sp. THN1]